MAPVNTVRVGEHFYMQIFQNREDHGVQLGGLDRDRERSGERGKDEHRCDNGRRNTPQAWSCPHA